MTVLHFEENRFIPYGMIGKEGLKFYGRPTKIHEKKETRYHHIINKRFIFFINVINKVVCIAMWVIINGETALGRTVREVIFVAHIILQINVCKEISVYQFIIIC